jgi:hypothetical protein
MKRAHSPARFTYETFSSVKFDRSLGVGYFDCQAKDDAWANAQYGDKSDTVGSDGA